MTDPGSQATTPPQIVSQMTTTVGQLDNFDRGKECYFEKLEQFVEIYNIAPERQVACLLAVIGVLRNLVYPRKPKDRKRYKKSQLY